MSIIKYGKYYWIYLPYIIVEDDLEKRCRWWGYYDTFEECYQVLLDKDKQYNHLTIDTKLLRKMKLKKLNEKCINS